MLRYSATSARVKSLSLASGCVNVCVFAYFFFSMQDVRVSNFSKCKMQIKPVKIGEIGWDFVKVEKFSKE